MQLDRMCELNVIEQMRALSYTTIVQDAWTRNQELSIHGWIYGLKNGRVNVMPLRIEGLGQVTAPYRFLRKSDVNDLEKAALSSSEPASDLELNKSPAMCEPPGRGIDRAMLPWYRKFFGTPSLFVNVLPASI